MTSTPLVTLSSRVQRAPSVLSAIVDNEAVLMDVSSGSYYGLLETGREIWQRLEEPVLVGDLCASLGREYSAPEGELEADTIEYLNRLAASGLITVD